MIQAKKLGHVVLKVRDAGKSRDFYVKTLGLKVAHEDLTRGAVFLSFGTEHHDLAVFQMASGETPTAEQPGLHHMAWQLGSFEELRIVGFSGRFGDHTEVLPRGPSDIRAGPM